MVKKNKLYIPKNNYYFGITLKFIKKHTKRKIFKKDIFIKDLSLADEILLVGSGKGIVKISSIPQIMWNNKSNAINENSSEAISNESEAQETNKHDIEPAYNIKKTLNYIILYS